MTLIPWYYRAAAMLLLVGAAYGLGRLHQAQADEAARNEAIIDRWKEGDKHVARYISRTTELADSLVVADRLVRLCRGQLRGARRTPSATAADPAGGGTDEVVQLGTELVRVQQNRFQCEALIDVVRPQVEDKPWWELW